MTISSTANKAIRYGNGVATSWPYKFLIPNASQLSVIVTDPQGNQSPLAPSQYSVSGIGSRNGGTVTFPLSGAPLAMGWAITIVRTLPIVQLTDIVNQDGFYPDVLEDSADYLTMVDQQLSESLSRTVSFPVVDDLTNVSPTLPPAAARANMALAFDGNGNPTVMQPGQLSSVPSTNVTTPDLTLSTLMKVGMNRVVDSIQALRLLPRVLYTRAFVTGYYQPHDGGGGGYQIDPTDLTSQDNGGTIIVAADGARWKLQLTAPISVMQFGAKGDGVTDDAAAINATIAWLATLGGGEAHFPNRTFLIKSTITVGTSANSGSSSNIRLSGTKNGSQITPGATMAALLTITGKNTSVDGLYLNNALNYATKGILFTTQSADGGFSGMIKECTIIGFNTTAADSAGISASGQNYNITGNFFENNKADIYITNDGRNSTINDNYMLGSAVGIRLGVASSGPVQAEGTRILNNTILPTGGNGAAIQLDAGLEIEIGFNILDQTGTNTPGIYCPIGGGNALARVKIIGNWIAAGQNSYSVYCSGNTADVKLLGNSIVSNNGLPATAGISLSNTNGYAIIGNVFSIVSGNDLSLSGAVNGTVLGNTSTQSESNALANVLSQTLNVSGIESANSYTVGAPGNPTITGGPGAPMDVQPPGSIYLRLDGGAGGHLYVSQGSGTWTAVAGV
ncbi:hypothetical protein K6L27_05060 [Burkholderia cenocepacia]|uniref:glycosyl hydrolase family 28-related protein n=1 Tax=Burkholderia cenocepacia TaxID=95486 RepID=UPI00222FFDD3|nr:glycosyl hydrolase family 28-related protein [Burkholderia cenocepacia]MCW3657536.1 hypothetical protein [Burkholderia cenocepacia]